MKTVKFLKRVQDLGFSLKDAQELLKLESCCAKTRPILVEACSEKILQIEQKIQDLNQMLELLRKFSRICGTEASVESECNLLDCFENDWECCNQTERQK